jgi:predicted RNA-binding Zn-ribbon protein involved in translation (DUF1610 family)
VPLYDLQSNAIDTRRPRLTTQARHYEILATGSLPVTFVREWTGMVVETPDCGSDAAYRYEECRPEVARYLTPGVPHASPQFTTTHHYRILATGALPLGRHALDED